MLPTWRTRESLWRGVFAELLAVCWIPTTAEVAVELSGPADQTLGDGCGRSCSQTVLSE